MRCRRVDIERYGALEMRCRRADVERYGARELERIVGISSFRSSRLFGQNACGLRRPFSSLNTSFLAAHTRADSASHMGVERIPRFSPILSTRLRFTIVHISPLAACNNSV